MGGFCTETPSKIYRTRSPRRGFPRGLPNAIRPTAAGKWCRDRSDRQDHPVSSARLDPKAIPEARDHPARGVIRAGRGLRVLSAHQEKWALPDRLERRVT